MRNRNETVTVLMPVYNAGSYLATAIESIRCQTHREFEFIIVNDGSTDGSGDLLQGIAAQDSRIHVVHATHEGIVAALNRGLALAKGTVIVRMDQDDIAMPERIERQLAFLAEHPEVVAVGSALWMIDKDGHLVGEPTAYPLTPEEVRDDLLKGFCSLAHPTVAMRRDVVLGVGGYRRPFQTAEDFDLWLRLSEQHALANMPDVFLHYRWHGDNATARRRRGRDLAGHVARLAAGERHLGRPDPTAGLDKLSVKDLDRFVLAPGERAAILLDLSEAGLQDYNANGQACHLADVEETLFAPGHPRSARASGIASQLAQHLWRAGERRRSVAAVGWRIRAEVSIRSRHAWRRAIARWSVRSGASRHRLAVVMYSTPGISEYATLAAEINKRYADRHGYDFIHNVAVDGGEMPVWEKVRVIRDLLPKYGSIFYIDSDAIFNLHAESLGFLLADRADLAACSDHPNGPYLANSGTFFIRSSPWARDLVERWWSLREDPTYHSFPFDQTALDALLRAGNSRRVRIYPASAFNSIAHEIEEGRRDTFVLHFMATTAEFRQTEFAHWLRRADGEGSRCLDGPREGGLDPSKVPQLERAAALLNLSEAGLAAYQATGEARHLADVEQILFADGYPRGVRGRGVAARLILHLWKAGEFRRGSAVWGWKAHAEMASISRQVARLVELANWGGRRAVRDWLVHCADPVEASTIRPRRALSPEESRELVAQADKHGVLPAVLRHYPPFQGDAAFADAKADALARHRSKLTYSLMLRTHGDALMAAAGGMPVVMVKGPVFSRTIYPAPGVRNFTDIDLLIAPEAEPQLARVLEQQGFRLAEHHRERQEWKWLHRDNESLMIEVHTNLVHHPELRKNMSIGYHDLAGIAETPAALLTVAVAHGALERYELLRQVVDVCQAARKVDAAEEEGRFETLVRQTGTRFAAIAGLDLAYRLFGEPRCRELARGLGSARYTTLARLLLGRSAITSTMAKARFLHSWRRQGFRVLLKRSGAS